MKTKITIAWKAFGRTEELTFDSEAFLRTLPNEEVCDEVFCQTNTYQGFLWEEIEGILPEGRSHTALSVGDEVTVNGQTYRCESMGWSLV